MNETAEAGGPSTGGVHKVPTLFAWKFRAREVLVSGSWDRQRLVKLQNHGSHHSIMLDLPPGQYSFRYIVDGSFRCDPSMSSQDAEGTSYNIISVNEAIEANEISALIEWNFSANEEYVHGSWDGYGQWTKLQNHGNGHSTTLPLRPGQYWFQYCVDGVFCHNPSLSWQLHEDGTSYNFRSFNGSGTERRPDDRYFVPLSLTKQCQSVVVIGSWDNWRDRIPLENSGDDHYLLLALHPGKYQMRFLVDGIEYLRPDIGYEYDAAGGVTGNTLNVPSGSTSRYLHGTTGAALMEDFMAMSGNELSIALKFNVGTPEILAVKRGVTHALNLDDMIVVDARHCQVTVPAKQPLSRAHVILDNFQFKQFLLRFAKDGNFPPYFGALFEFLDHVPKDFDTNQAARAEYLDLYDNQAALARPPRRMLALVNMAQFFKQLPAKRKDHFATMFKSIIKNCDWQQIIHNDKLFEVIYMHNRTVRVDQYGRLIEPVPNTSLEASNCVRVFFVHSPEHTIENDIQLLKAYAEIDLIIAHYYHDLVAEVIALSNRLKSHHELLRAMWDFYCGGTITHSASVLQRIEPAGHYEFKD